MPMMLGMQCMHAGSFASSPARLADLATDPRWRYRFKLLSLQYAPQLPRTPVFSGQIATAKLRDAALEALASPSSTAVTFGVSKKESTDHAHFKVETGRHPIFPDSRFSANAKWHVPEGVELEALAATWIELQHEILVALDATHGVLVTATDPW